MQRLQDSYRASKIHSYTPGRQLAPQHRATDYLALGCEPLKLKTTMDRWAETRLIERSTSEISEVLEDDVIL